MAVKQILVPDIGDFSDVAIIEVYVSEGATVEVDDSIIALESAKAVTDIPSPYAGTITKIHVKAGDSANTGTLLADIEVAEKEVEVEKEKEVEPVKEEPTFTPPLVQKEEVVAQPPVVQTSSTDTTVYHASPSVRQYARELGVELHQVVGTGPHLRIQRTDIQDFVKQVVTGGVSGALSQEKPLEDFSVYGEFEIQELTRIQKISGPHLQRGWQNIPLVTQYDEADITSLEMYRQQIKGELAQQGIRVSILPFIVKAVTKALKQFPALNASYDPINKNLVLKKYYNIGIAVDTPQGLVVPVVKNADQKGIKEIANELAAISERAREGRLTPSDISGSSFSISSLGGIGGTSFTPLINPPEVAILGVSKMMKKPLFNGETFEPRDVVPLSLSYDHRVIDGAMGVRFTTYLVSLLEEMRNILL